MTLSEYLQTTTQREFAGHLGVTQSMVSHWLAGRYRISPEIATRIERLTGGAVTAKELRPDLADIFGATTQDNEAA
ncbi:hypothetical protein BH20PSE1_BH20PSE1_01360 [soil metagenome]